jgi:hypothetical protein
VFDRLVETGKLEGLQYEHWLQVLRQVDGGQPLADAKKTVAAADWIVAEVETCQDRRISAPMVWLMAKVRRACGLDGNGAHGDEVGSQERIAAMRRGPVHG